jgi:hypothetical protein
LESNGDEEQQVCQKVSGIRNLDLWSLLEKPETHSETDNEWRHGHYEDAQSEEDPEEAEC